ncbi:MAG TPA: VOC family protein [Actinomycetota bacterium]|nr:VOC family protein [Actinomycetota bacterium]
MTDPFVWFDLRSTDAAKSRAFHEELFGWKVAEVPTGNGTLSMIGAEEPWASLIADAGEHVGWFPYIQVDDLKAATERAEKLGATVLQPATEGPAGTYTPIREPGGAVFALFEMRT